MEFKITLDDIELEDKIQEHRDWEEQYGKGSYTEEDFVRGVLETVFVSVDVEKV